MGIMTIDGQSIEFTDEPNVLSVIRKAGIDIPTLCYHSELSIYGACQSFVQWKMTGERPLPPVQKNQKTEWSSIRIHQG